MAGLPVLVKQGDFLCYRSQSSSSGDDVVVHLPGAAGPALQRLDAPHRRLGRYPFAGGRALSGSCLSQGASGPRLGAGISIAYGTKGPAGWDGQSLPS